MARTPTKSQSELSEPSNYAKILAQGLAEGLTPAQLAKKLAKGDEKEAKRLRQRFRNMIYRDQRDLKMAVAQQASGDMLAGLPGTVKAVTRRAHRGRMDAARVVLESTGFHNPRVQHEHSGEVKVTLDMPRPRFEQDTIDVPEADVVED